MKEGIAARPTAGIDLRIATRVAALRAQAGLTLEALAVACDVSRSMISLVERGEISATAVVLEKIASGLGVTLATLFDDPCVPASPVSRSRDRTPWRDPQSGYVRQNISPPNFPAPLQIVAVELPAGAAVSYENGARSDLHQQIWVRAGTIEVTIGKLTHRLSEDDCLAMQLNEPTSFRNRTRKTARYIVVIANDKSLKR
jgi:transcriptional regulator with XRE-family HTH domain